MKNILRRISALVCAALLCAAAVLPVCAASVDGAPAEESVCETMQGVFQFGQLPAQADSSDAGLLSGGIQTFALEPGVDYAAQLDALLTEALTADDAFSAAASLRVEVNSLYIPVEGETGNRTSPLLKAALQAVLNAHPEWYFLSPDYTYGVIQPSSGAIVNSITLKTSGLYGQELADQRADLDRQVQAILDDLPAGADPRTLAVLLHDEISSRVAYDYSFSGNCYNMYGALMENSAVCQGIALAYEYLLEQCGISSCIISSEKLNHAWNAVQVDGVWYQTDCTWDQTSLGSCNHRHLLLSREEMCKRHSDDAATSDQTCTDLPWGEQSLSDAWWTELVQPFAWTADGQIFWSVNGGEDSDYHSLIYRGDLSGENAVWVADLGPWWVDSAHTVKSGSASAALCINGEGLYLADADNVYLYSLDEQPALLQSYPNRVEEGGILRLTGLMQPDRTQSAVRWYAAQLFGLAAQQSGPLPADGDLNGDGVVNSKDLQALADHLVGLPSEKALTLSSADLDNDGVLTLTDLVLLARLLAA